MAETRLSTKRRLSIKLSFLNLTTQTNSTQKSPKTFHDPNGVVGLQILAALNHTNDHENRRRHHRQDSIFINGISTSPKSSSSNPIPIHHKPHFDNKLISMEEIELCEEYTCVISHVGDKLVKKREYFEVDLFGNDINEERVFVVSDNSSVNNCGGGGGGDGVDPRGFLNTCFLCDKVLDGLDIFMYRGEKAFCSVECRHKQISMDEGKDKCHHRSSSGMRKQMDCSAASSCSSSPMQFFAGVAAA